MTASPRVDPNPYLDLLHQSLRDSGVTVLPITRRGLWREDFDILHLHWPERFVNRPGRWRAALGLAYLFAILGYARLRHRPVVWTAHNVQAHESDHPLLESFMWAVLTRAVAGTVHLSETAEAAAYAVHPALRKRMNVVVPHGDYRPRYPDPPDRRESRAALGLPVDVPLLGCIGAIRAYKGLDELVAAFAEMTSGDAQLLIAGPAFDATLVDRLRAAQSACDGRLRVEPAVIPETLIPHHVRALDVMVLAYTRVWNSGAALLSLSLDTPILAPSVPLFVELQQEVGPDWVTLYDDPLTGAHLDAALARARSHSVDARADLSGRAWPAAAAALGAFYSSLGSAA
jgi:beta-1,4-mannosyltransferase